MANNTARSVREINGNHTIDELDDSLACEDSGVHEVSVEMAELQARQDASEAKRKTYQRRIKRRLRRTQQILAGERPDPVDPDAE